MIPDRLDGRRILLLQGPIGPYFRQLAAKLKSRGAEAVLKINFNGGDKLFFPEGIDYRGDMAGAPAFVESVLVTERIDTIALFGDCRPVHAGIVDLAKRLGIRIRVYEEGYFRPAFVTCELDGANGFSSIPSSREFYRDLPDSPPKQELAPVAWAYWAMAVWASLYYVAAALGRGLFAGYQHHRPLDLVDEASNWVRGALRKWLYRAREKGMLETLTGEMSGKFFIVPLQVHNDAQVTIHSDYEDVRDFIGEVIASFARFAPSDMALVLKHHPMDRAYRDYAALIESQAQLYGVGQRVLYIHDQHLPTLLNHAAGAVVINSTVGLSAIHQGVPTKVRGRAFYDFEGLTFQGPLHTFWANAHKQRPECWLYRKFRAWVIDNSQVNDNFYAPISGKPVPAMPSKTAKPEAATSITREALEQQH